MTVNSVREQAKKALIDEVEIKTNLDTVADTYLDNPSPTLEQTIRLAESFGGTARLIVEIPEAQPLQQD